MGHGLEESDRMADVGKLAWHGLGQALPEGIGAEDAAKLIGCDWRTKLVPVLAEGMGPVGSGSAHALIPDHFAHMRADNGAFLGIVQKDYVPVENLDVARFADGLAGPDRAMVCESTGTLFSGKRFWSLMRMPRDIDLPKGDRIATYVAVANGHGGTAAFSCYPTTVRIVCANTLRLSERDLSKGVRFIHRAGGDREAMAEKLKTAQLVLGFADKAVAKFEEQARALVARGWNEADAYSFFQVTFSALWPLGEGAASDTEAKWREKRNDIVAQWLRVFHSEKCAAVFGANAWTGTQAVTDWLDHASGRGKASLGSAERTQSNLFGAADKQKGQVFRLALSSL
jgi:phage/plasmid-like protein (TIGR03299 family)